MNKNTHLWIIRAYALIILVVLAGGFLEGVALNLIITLAAVLIIIWSFLLKTGGDEGR